jgi:hypothetical protein
MKKNVDYIDIFPRGRQDPVMERLEMTAKDQASISLELGGKLLGFQRLVSHTTSGKVKKVVDEIEELTRGDYCTSEVDNLYSGIENKAKYIGVTKRAQSGECTCAIFYIDACLFGARVAELSGLNKQSKELYSRAREAINAKKGFSHEYTSAYEQREKTWKRAMKRMYKNGEKTK